MTPNEHGVWLPEERIHEVKRGVADALKLLEDWNPAGQELGRVVCWRRAIALLGEAQWFLGQVEPKDPGPPYWNDHSDGGAGDADA